MKSLKITCLLLLAVLSLTFDAEAQKIAHLNYDSLIVLMPETKLASQAANAYLQELDALFSSMQAEYDKKLEQYQKTPQMSELLANTRKRELEDLQKRIQEFQTQAQQDFQQKQLALSTPIMLKAKKAIEVVAKAKGFKYVLDSTNKSTFILYCEKSEDILALVKKQLDSMPEAVLPLSQGTQSDTGK